MVNSLTLYPERVKFVASIKRRNGRMADSLVLYPEQFTRSLNCLADQAAQPSKASYFFVVKTKKE